MRKTIRLRDILTVPVILGCLGVLPPAAARAGNWEADFESGYVNSGYNVVRIPGDGGTQISLSDAFRIRPAVFWRFKVYYDFNEEHALGLLLAPLRLGGDGEAPFPVTFTDVTFPAHTPLRAVYRFDSYRLTYRYRFWKTDALQAHIGFTAKIRDAEISLEGNGVKASKTNVGFVPLLYFRLAWNIAGPWGLVLDADALAAPQGRAEDLLLALEYQADEQWSLKTGYRMVEGGADNAEVYNFALIHYGVIGITARY